MAEERKKGPPAQPDWMPASAVGKLFGDPPAPQLKWLKHKEMAWETDANTPKIYRIAKFQREDPVKIKDGTAELNRKGRPPRPRSAVVLKTELANLNVHPKPSQQSYPEAVYLVHCDSTDTT